MTTIPQATVPPPIEPLSWLLGKWKSTSACAKYPTMDNFCYDEELEFFHLGKPVVQFQFYSNPPGGDTVVHREVGFIRINPGTNKIAFIIAHNNGLCDIEEGEFHNKSIKVLSHTVGRLSFGKEPATVKVGRTIDLKDNDELEMVVYMETTKTPYQEHL